MCRALGDVEHRHRRAAPADPHDRARRSHPRRPRRTVRVAAHGVHHRHRCEQALDVAVHARRTRRPASARPPRCPGRSLGERGLDHRARRASADVFTLTSRIASLSRSPRKQPASRDVVGLGTPCSQVRRATPVRVQPSYGVLRAPGCTGERLAPARTPQGRRRHPPRSGPWPQAGQVRRAGAAPAHQVGERRNPAGAWRSRSAAVAGVPPPRPERSQRSPPVTRRRAG